MQYFILKSSDFYYSKFDGSELDFVKIQKNLIKKTIVGLLDINKNRKDIFSKINTIF
jgi:hypothetical protein